MVESLKLCLQLLMLLGNLIYNQSDVMQHCPLQNIFSNFAAEAGSPFYFRILHITTQKHLRQLQISLASGKDLPPWVEYRHHTGHLVGLALPEDCGIHHLQISVTTHNCTADLFVHIRNATIPGNSSKRGTCPDREIRVWGNLILQLNPVHFNASRRIHLVNTMADYFHLLWNSISLFSSKNFNVPYHEMLWVCGPSDLQEKDFKRDGALGNFIQMLWHFGCKSQEQLFFLLDTFNNVFETGILIKQLDVQVLAWRLLCPVEVTHKVKRDLRLDVSTFPSKLTNMIEQENSRENEGLKFAQTNFMTINDFVQSRDIDSFSSDHAESDMRTLPLSFEQNISPVRSTLKYVTTNSEWLPTSLTPRPHQDASDSWTEMDGYSHSESPAPDPLKSLDHSHFTQDFSSPSVTDKYQRETYEVSLSFGTDQSLQSSNAIYSTQTVFPTLHLSQSSNSEQTGPKISPTVSGAGQEAISWLNATMTDLTLATLVSQTSLHLLESSMHVSFTTGPTALTPPLPFAYSTSDLPSTYDNSPLFTVQDFSNSKVFSTIQQNELLGSNLPSEMTDSSSVCSDQFGQACFSSFLETSKPASDDLHFPTSFQAVQSMSLITEQIQIPSDYHQINSVHIQPSFSQLFAVSNHVSSSVSLHSSSAHANLNTTTTSTATIRPSVTYPDQVSTNGISATVSNHFETITTGQQTFASSTRHLLEKSHVEETLYSSMFLTSQQWDAAQNVHPTHEMMQNATISDMSLETMESEMTQNNLESSLYYSYSPEPTENKYTLPLISEYSTFGLSWTFGNINPALTIQDFSSVTPHTELAMKTQSKLDIADSSNICSDQNGQFYCFGISLTSEFLHTNLQSFQSTFEDLQLQTTEELLERSQQTNIKPSFASSLSNIQTMLFTDIESEYGFTSNAYLSNILPTNLLPSVINSIGLSSSFLETSEPTTDDLHFPTSFQEIQTMSLMSAQIQILSDLSNIQTVLFTDIESEYVLTSNVYLSNILPPALLSSVMNSNDFSASGSITATSYFEEITPSTVHELYAVSTIYLFESLEPSFPLCNSVDFSRCASTVASILPENTNEYWTSHLIDSLYWTSEVALGGQIYSATWQHAETEKYLSFKPESYTYFTISASTSAQLSQNYLSATHQMPSDTPSYITTLPVMTFSPLGSSALTEHCKIERVSLLNCQSSIQASVGPTKQSPHFSLYSAVSTTLLLSQGHSSSHIIKLSTSSVTATSTVNFPPQVLQTIPALTATVGFPFSYSLPENTFVDPEDGTADALSLEMRLIDPPPPSVGSWLSLDGLELHGIPLEMDTHFAPQQAILLSRDKGGLITSIRFSVDLFHNPLQPCHVFTISAHLSLHSILLHRHKIEQFLTKISAYFNDTISNHLSIVSISSGSTVMSWYNSSLCDNGKCYYDKIRRMWLAMRFENKTINSKFRDAMLPEFPLINIEPVSYTQDCFPPTHIPTTTFKSTSEEQTTSNLSTTAVTTSSVQVASYGKMASMFIALLVICSLILIVLFVTAIVYFCQRKPRVVAIFPASRMLSVRSVDLRALRPRRALLLHPEIPPPPLRLWISLNEEDDQLSPESQQQQTDNDTQQLPSKYKSSNI